MYTFLILIYGSLTVGLILTMITHKDVFLTIGAIIAAVCSTLLVGYNLITKQVYKPTEIATPSKYTNQTYYISSNYQWWVAYFKITI